MFHRPKTEQEAPEQKAGDREQTPVEKYIQKEQFAYGQKEQYGWAAEETAVKQPVQASQVQAKEEKVMNNDQQDYQDNSFEDRPMAAAPAGVPFQRPPQMQRSMPSFGGSYGSNAAQNAPAQNSAERRLVISQGITLTGEIEACDHLVVEGTMEAALKGAKVLEIAETGVFYGAVEIEEATIAGRFEGELTVNGRITVKSTGAVTGSIAYKELAIEAGAVVDGKLNPLASVAAQAGQPKKSMAAKNDNGGRQGSELPFAGNVAAAE